MSWEELSYSTLSVSSTYDVSSRSFLESWTALEVAACGYMWPWAIEYLPTASSMIG